MGKWIQNDKKKFIALVLQSFLMTLSSPLLNVQAEWGVWIMTALCGETEAGMAVGLWHLWQVWTSQDPTPLKGRPSHPARGQTEGEKPLDPGLIKLSDKELTNVLGPCSGSSSAQHASISSEHLDAQQLKRWFNQGKGLWGPLLGLNLPPPFISCIISGQSLGLGGLACKVEITLPTSSSYFKG